MTEATGEDRSPATPRWVWIIVMVLLCQMAAGMVLSGRNESPTNDEPAHIGAGVAYVYGHDLRWGPEHPPLVKVLAALSLRASGVHIDRAALEDPKFDEYELGRRALFGGPPATAATRLALARAPVALLTLLFAFAVFGFARDLFGPRAALVPLAIVTSFPSIVAHGHLVTTDTTMAGFVLTATWFAWRARADRRWVVAAGVGLGLALCSKGTALLLAPLVVGLVAESALRSNGGSWRRAVTWAAGAAILATAIVWVVYLCIDPALRFDRPIPAEARVTGPLAAAADVLPFPGPYRQGLQMLGGIESRGSRSFLLGHRYVGGEPAFYPIVLAIKTPPATLALFALAIVVVLAGRRRGEVGLYVLAPAGLALVIGLLSSTNLGVRHVLAVPIFLAVAAGAVVRQLPDDRRRNMILVLGCGVLVVPAWVSFPNHLAYVSYLFGGQRRGPELLSDSNIDWGQDLGRLAGHLRSSPASEAPWLLYFGSARPEGYGIRARDLTNVRDSREVHGTVYAPVTALNSFYGDRFDWLRKGHHPVGRVGGSILIYEIP